MVESAMQGCAVRWPALAPEISPELVGGWLGLLGYYFGYLGPLEIFGGASCIMRHPTWTKLQPDKPTRKRRQLVSIMAESKYPPPTWASEANKQLVPGLAGSLIIATSGRMKDTKV